MLRGRRLEADDRRRILSLLDSRQMSHRQIARETRVNRKTVDRLARRPDPPRQADSDEGPQFVDGPAVRCGTCGRLTRPHADGVRECYGCRLEAQLAEAAA